MFEFLVEENVQLMRELLKVKKTDFRFNLGMTYNIILKSSE